MLNGLTVIPKGIYNLAETAAAQLYSNQTPQQKEEIFQKHRPMEYPGFGAAARSFLHDGPPRMDDKGNLAIEEEAWRKALNLPTKSNYIRESKYRPTSATDPNAKYYTFHPNVIDSQKLIDYVNSDVWDKNKKKSKSGKEYLQMSSLVPFMKQDFIDRQFFDEGQSMADYDPLQNFQVYKGYDPVKKKNYISISDRYDFNSKPVQAVIKPYDFYDRFYYEDGGKVQENYNDYSLSAPEGYVGSGYFNEGRNYSPAWGGQFKYGGKVCDSCQKAEDGEKLSVDERRKRVLAKANEIFSNKDLPYQLPDYVVNSKEAQGHAGSVCIHGVCGIMTDVGFVPHGYYTNTSFAEHAQDYGFSRSLGDIRLLKPGDIFQWKQATNYQGKPYPTHAQIFKGIDPNTGMYQFYDYYSKYHDGPGIRSYSKEEIENALKNIDTKDAYNSAQFFSLDPSAVGGIPENPFPYNLSEKEQQQHFADTHESNTKYSVEQPQYPLLDTDGYDRAQTKNKLVSYFNDKKLDEEIRKKLKITDQELQKVKPLIYGIMDQETDFGNPNAPVRNLKYDIKELLGLGSHSMGPAAVKYEALSPETKKAFNIKSPRDLSDLKNSYIGALDVLTKGAKYTDAYINRGEHIGISNKHPLARALYWYNNPSNITRSDSETRDLISDQAKDLWFNMYNPNKKSFGPFGTFETPEDIELRAFNSPLTMDRGSYPDKVIQQSKKLRKTIDFNDPSILENVEVKSIPYSMQSEPVIEGYRPLINYGGFVSDVPVDYSPPPYEEPYFAMGGSIPGSVGFTYARTGSIPSNGPYAKKTKASAQDGTVLSSEPVKKEGETTAADPVDENRMRQQERVIGNVPKDIIKQGRSSYRYDMLKNAIMQDMAKEQSIPLDQLDKKEVKKRTKELLAKREAQMATPDVEYVHGSGISKKPSVLGYYLPGRLNPLVSLSDTLNKYPIDFFENVANHEYAHAYYDGANLLTNYEKDLINQKLKETNDLYMSDPEYKKSTEDPKYAKYYDHNKYIGSQEEIAARLKALHDTLSDNITIQPKARVSSPKIENSITLGTPVDGPAFDNENEDAPRRYDPKQDKVKPEYIKKVEKDPLVKELLRVLTPEKIAELMNTIATNAPKQGAPMAKNGKKIIPIAQTGKYLPKEVSGELEPIQLDPEEEAPFMFMGKPYEELDRSREFPHLVPTLPAEELYPINININQKNLGLAEHTFTHQPGMKYDENLEGVPSDNYMLKRTVNSFPTDEDVRLNIQMPTSPKDVNFISNYKGAIGHVDQYPTSVPFEGEKHWNIDRFIIDPQFGIGIPALENDATDKTQQRRNVLADMYKYYMLQNKGDKDAAWKQANEFMSKEIDPRISGPMYDKLRGNINYSSGMGITSVVDDDYVRNFNQLKNSANIPDSERSEVEKDFLKNPISDKQAKDLAMDWLINYKKMSPKAAEAYYNKLPKKQNGGEMRFYQDGLDFKPKSISKKGKKIIKDDRGQWAHPGEITKIGSNNITMKGVPYPVLGISDLGDIQLMYPDQDYTYRGNSVIEYPMMAQGGQLTKLDQLTNFTNYNTKQPGGWLDKYK
jgi:hypothetical protein